MKDSLDKHESGHQLADYRIMETQVECVINYTDPCDYVLVYTVFGTFSEIQEYYGGVQWRTGELQGKE